MEKAMLMQKNGHMEIGYTYQICTRSNMGHFVIKPAFEFSTKRDLNKSPQLLARKLKFHY